MTKTSRDYSVCTQTEDGNHVPDWQSLSVDHSNEIVYIDVSCLLCGRSGCVGTEKTLAQDINW